MNLKDILTVTEIRIPLESLTKNAIIEEMVDILFKNHKIQDRDKIIKALHEREELMSTGVGDGVAIPHAKTEGIDRISAVFGITRQDVDFQSLDNKPVRLIFLLVGPANQPVPHLKALSRISRLMHQPEFRARLLQVQKPVDALNVILDEEKKNYEN